MKLTTALKASFGALALAFAAQAGAGPILMVSNGILTGAKNVSVQGALYDVTFVDGSCSALFGGCNEASDFTFTTLVSARAAAQALYEQVFVSAFDTDPELTFGCTNTAYCDSYIPYASASAGFYKLVAASNRADAQSDFKYDGTASFTSNFASYSGNNFARFQLAGNAVEAVPEPTSIALFGLGLAGLAFLRRRKS